MNSGLRVSDVVDDFKVRTKLDLARLQRCILGSTVGLLLRSWCAPPTSYSHVCPRAGILGS